MTYSLPGRVICWLTAPCYTRIMTLLACMAISWLGGYLLWPCLLLAPSATTQQVKAVHQQIQQQAVHLQQLPSLPVLQQQDAHLPETVPATESAFKFLWDGERVTLLSARMSEQQVTFELSLPWRQTLSLFQQLATGIYPWRLVHFSLESSGAEHLHLSMQLVRDNDAI